MYRAAAGIKSRQGGTPGLLSGANDERRQENDRMKKWLAVIACGLLAVLALAACGAKDDSSAQNLSLIHI